jgi:hypothetical protein
MLLKSFCRRAGCQFASGPPTIAIIAWLVGSNNGQADVEEAIEPTVSRRDCLWVHGMLVSAR